MTFHEGLFPTPAFGCEASPHADLGWYQVQLSLMPSSSGCDGRCCYPELQGHLLPRLAAPFSFQDLVLIWQTAFK